MRIRFECGGQIDGAEQTEDPKSQRVETRRTARTGAGGTQLVHSDGKQRDNGLTDAQQVRPRLHGNRCAGEAARAAEMRQPDISRQMRSANGPEIRQGPHAASE
jgi:hypothetical protein